mmetsp:Transcript_50269/g.79611  ORF Transcript_50269/g.79611 Transcript_50269/m.79611 type:complete len:296 (-) Transcript_50269:60-947(-)
MRVKRAKNHRRILRFFRLAFNIQEPYRVLVDGSFISHALQHKFHIKEQLPKILTGRTTLMVTNCVMAELRSLGDTALGAAIIAKGYYRIKCAHDRPIGAARCICEQIGKTNERSFIVATQNNELAWNLRQVPGVPLIRLNGPVPTIEDASAVSKTAASARESQKLKPSNWELPKLPALKEREAKAAELIARPPKKRKGPKGPNPLSCMKKKKKTVNEAAHQVVPNAFVATPTLQASSKRPKRVRSRRAPKRPILQQSTEVVPTTEAPSKRPKRVRSRRVAKCSTVQQSAPSDAAV